MSTQPNGTYTFTLTPAEFSNKQAELTKAGITCTGTSGTISHDNITASFSYDGKSVLTVAVIHHPLFIPIGLIDKKLSDWFQMQ